MKVILRVDDLGWVPPDKLADKDLAYVDRWLAAGKLHGVPGAFGVMPAVLGREACRAIQERIPGPYLAVHGWDHVHRAVVGIGEMADGRDMLGRTEQYIPPFNEYDVSTMLYWERVGGRLFYGGFKGEHHHLAAWPQTFGKLTHIPAWRPSYDRAGPLLESLPWLRSRFRDSPVPCVLTLHCTWDAANLPAVGELIDAVRDEIVEPVYAETFARRLEGLVTPEVLTGPHSAAVRWTLEQLAPHWPGGKILDFGARYGKLSSLMAYCGFDVHAFDRDPGVMQWQADLARTMGVHYRSTWGDTDQLLAQEGPESFDAITATWAIQHQASVDGIAAVSEKLARLLKPGGRLLVVGAFDPKGVRHDAGRQDPLFALDRDAQSRYILGPAGLLLERMEFFRYDHGTPNYQFCPEAEANAVAFVGRKP
jgi:SAM-dependent methyltransferase